VAEVTPGRKDRAHDRALAVLLVVVAGMAAGLLDSEEAWVGVEGLAMLLATFTTGNGAEHWAKRGQGGANAVRGDG
jgi:hypothetical protein